MSRQGIGYTRIDGARLDGQSPVLQALQTIIDRARAEDAFAAGASGDGGSSAAAGPAAGSAQANAGHMALARDAAPSARDYSISSVTLMDLLRANWHQRDRVAGRLNDYLKRKGFPANDSGWVSIPDQSPYAILQVDLNELFAGDDGIQLALTSRSSASLADAQAIDDAASESATQALVLLIFYRKLYQLNFHQAVIRAALRLSGQNELLKVDTEVLGKANLLVMGANDSGYKLGIFPDGEGGVYINLHHYNTAREPSDFAGRTFDTAAVNYESSVLVRIKAPSDARQLAWHDASIDVVSVAVNARDSRIEQAFIPRSAPIAFDRRFAQVARQACGLVKTLDCDHKELIHSYIRVLFGQIESSAQVNDLVFIAKLDEVDANSPKGRATLDIMNRLNSFRQFINDYRTSSPEFSHTLQRAIADFADLSFNSGNPEVRALHELLLTFMCQEYHCSYLRNQVRLDSGVPPVVLPPSTPTVRPWAYYMLAFSALTTMGCVSLAAAEDFGYTNLFTRRHDKTVFVMAIATVGLIPCLLTVLAILLRHCCCRPKDVAIKAGRSKPVSAAALSEASLLSSGDIEAGVAATTTTTTRNDADDAGNSSGDDDGVPGVYVVTP